jgi:hypothetical protein
MLQLATAVQRAAGRSTPPRTVSPTALRLAAATVGRAVPRLGRVVRASLAMDTADHPAPLNDVRQQYPGVPCTGLSDVLSAMPLPRDPHLREREQNQRAGTVLDEANGDNDQGAPR